jgi:tripartite-type tricarboxylate transporter receptor subunit TctC
MERRHFISTNLAGAMLSMLQAQRARAQAIDQARIVYGFSTGSAGDLLSRRVAEKLAGTAYSRLPGIVENRPGAGGRLALEALKASAPDGATLALSPFTATAIYPHVYKKLAYDAAADFEPVSMAAVMFHGLAVGPLVSTDVHTVKDFLAWAKANPSLANYGSPGAGSTQHFLGALLGLNTGVTLGHVAYRGSVPGVADVIGGQVAAMVAPSGDYLTNHKAGKLRILATSGSKRSPFIADVATFAEQGFPELTVEEWFGFYAKRGTPASVVAASNTAITSALKDPAIIDSLGAVGLLARGSTPAQMAASEKAEFERWGPLVKKVGFTAES